MKFPTLNPLLHSELRLAVMSLLISAGLRAFEEYVEALKSYLNVK